jgi:hypothetical protein
MSMKRFDCSGSSGGGLGLRGMGSRIAYLPKNRPFNPFIRLPIKILGYAVFAQWNSEKLDVMNNDRRGDDGFNCLRSGDVQESKWTLNVNWWIVWMNCDEERRRVPYDNIFAIKVIGIACHNSSKNTIIRNNTQ